ncbi:MAG: hypothetical protein Fur0015_13410 [Ignavibacteriales bacterium]
MVDIFIVILLLSASVLCVYLVYTLKKLTESIKVMQNDIDKLVTTTLPVLENINQVSEKALRLTNMAEHQVYALQTRLENLKSNFQPLFSFGKTGAQNSVTEFITNLRAITKGIISFIKELKK